MIEDVLLPTLRDDITINVIEENSNKLAVLSDPKGYASQEIALPIDLISLFRIIDEALTVNQLRETLRSMMGREPDLEPIINILNVLNNLGYLESPAFSIMKEEIDAYRASPVRPSVCAGFTYPDAPEKLSKKMDALLSSVNPKEIKPGATALIVPHIDFNVKAKARETYAAAYQAIRGADADLFVILGVAHRHNLDYFMFTEKDFETPLGVVKTDKELLDDLKNELSFPPTIDDTPHFKEHSIEIQLPLLQRMFVGKDFVCLPILIGSFHEFFQSGARPSSDKRLNEYISSLKKVIEKRGRKAIYIASVDFGHIGRRFEDDFDAAPALPELKDADLSLIANLERGDHEEFFKRIAKNNNQYHICGVSPIYALLEIMRPKKGTLLKYEQWNDAPTLSAVSFASMAFYE